MIELKKPHTQYEGTWIGNPSGALFLIKYVEDIKTSDKTTHIRFLSIVCDLDQKINTLKKFWVNDHDASLDFLKPRMQNYRTAVKAIL